MPRKEIVDKAKRDLAQREERVDRGGRVRARGDGSHPPGEARRALDQAGDRDRPLRGASRRRAAQAAAPRSRVEPHAALGRARLRRGAGAPEAARAVAANAAAPPNARSSARGTPRPRRGRSRPRRAAPPSDGQPPIARAPPSRRPRRRPARTRARAAKQRSPRLARLTDPAVWSSPSADSASAPGRAASTA